jgi:hypothetical protein
VLECKTEASIRLAENALKTCVVVLRGGAWTVLATSGCNSRLQTARE